MSDRQVYREPEPVVTPMLIRVHTPHQEYIPCDPEYLEARTGIARGVWQLVMDECAYPNKVVRYIFEAWYAKQRLKADPVQTVFQEKG